MNKIFFAIIGVVFALGVCIAEAQVDEASTQYGVGGLASFGADNHFAPIKGLPGVPSCCPEYNSALAFTPAIDLLAHLRFSQSFRGEMRLGFDYHPSTLTAQVATTIAPSGVEEQAIIDHQLTTMRAYFSVSPLLSFDVSRRLSVLGGIRAGFLAASSFSQKEVLVSPSDVTYEDGSRTRFVIDSNAVPDAATTRLAAVAGLRYDIPVTTDERWHIMPEIVAVYGLGSLQSSQQWNQSSIRLGVGVVWQNYKLPEPPPPPDPVVPVIVENRDSIEAARRDSIAAAKRDSLLAAQKEEEARKAKQKKTYAFSIAEASSQLLDANNQPLATQKLVVTNAVSLNLYALLNYIFFDSASAVIPDRYHRLTSDDTRSFKLDQLNGAGTFAIYRDLLNIVGYKLRNSPSEKIVITGCNSDEGAERSNRDLSRARASAVRDYLVSIWSIDPARIDLQARNKPENPSSDNVVDGNQENRRVEITGPENRILDPIFFTDTLRSVNAKSLVISADIKADTAIRNWTLDIYQGTRLLEKLSGKGAVPAPIRWNISAKSDKLPNTKDPIRFDLEVVDEAGQRQTLQPTGYQVEQVYRSDKKTEKFNMIIFGFNESEFTKQHDRILDIIRPRITPKSKVTVEGYTDRLGGEDYNLRLSQRRASAVAQRLNLKRENAKGYGSGGGIFDNNTPEGRLYSRTVIITIETPME